jgi:rod shape-determining protein MreC
MIYRRRRSARWILAVLATAVVLFFLFPQTRNRPLSLLEAPVVWTASRITELAAGVTGWVAGTWTEYVDLRRVRRRADQLTAERDALEVALADAREQAARADRLEALLSLKERVERPAVPARVLGTDATHWFRSLLVDRGGFDGVTVGDGVIAPGGVVGRVAKVTHTTAQVLSLYDRGSVIPARVQRSRQAGVLVGGVRPSAVDRLAAEEGADLPPPEMLAELKYLHRSADVVVGDAVVTSGQEGRFPPGVPIGTVVRVVRTKTETFLKVYVAPALDFGTLEEVLVVHALPETPEAP